jgi:hypothetical protein
VVETNAGFVFGKDSFLAGVKAAKNSSLVLSGSGSEVLEMDWWREAGTSTTLRIEAGILAEARTSTTLRIEAGILAETALRSVFGVLASEAKGLAV